jgi:hypothetical protein
MTFLGLLLGSVAFTLVQASPRTLDIPPEYQSLYSSLKTNLDSFDSYLNSQTVAGNYPVIFAAELLPANDNRGTDLLTPQALQSTAMYLDRLQELGVQAVTLPIGYQLYLAFINLEEVDWAPRQSTM